MLIGDLYLMVSCLWVCRDWAAGLRSNAPFLRFLAVTLFMPWSTLLFVFIGGLWCFHVYLCLRCSTTSEFLRGHSTATSETSLQICANKMKTCSGGHPTRLRPMWRKTVISQDDNFEDELDKAEKSLDALRRSLQ